MQVKTVKFHLWHAVLFFLPLLSAKEIDSSCPQPTSDLGYVRFVDKWPGGFAGIVEIQRVSDSLEEKSEWTIVLILDTPVGKNVSIKSWKMKLITNFDDGKAFAFAHSDSGAYAINSSPSFHALFVIDNITGERPRAAYVGYFDHFVEDPSCVTAPTFAPLRSLYSEINTTSVPEIENTDAPNMDYSTVSAHSTPQTTPNPTSTQAPTSKSILSTTAEAVTNSEVITRAIDIDLEENGEYCLLQRHEDSYVAEKGWLDSGKHFFSGDIVLKPEENLDDWSMVVVFDTEVTTVQSWACRVNNNSDDGTTWVFGSHPWNPTLYSGLFSVRFIAVQAYATVQYPQAQVYLCSSLFTSGDAIFGTGNTLYSSKSSPESELPTGSWIHTLQPTSSTTQKSSPTSEHGRCDADASVGHPVIRAQQTELNFLPNNDGTKYNYNEVIHKSILFYEAQRSGPLPSSHRIPWVGDSDLKDGCDIGVDLTGGWHDAGDGVKFNFPMAYSLTTLAWGAITFREAYKDAGELENIIECLKWPAKYFMKAHISKYELVGQVGHGQTDHNYWGRPEEAKIQRPAYSISDKKPGSELAAEVAAALAATAIFFNQSDYDFSQRALRHAEELFEFADKFRGSYHKSIKDAEKYYKSYSGYRDELLWAATWLYKATLKKTYLDKAESKYAMMSAKNKIAQEFSWDDKLLGAQILLANMTGKTEYRRPLSIYLDNLRRTKTTPQGMYYLREWGSTRYAANAALISIMSATLQPPLPKKASYLTWARKQIGLLLGDAGRSFVVGFGENWPKRAHHKASSCPPYPERCDWSNYHTSENNHYILYGALVGGPNLKGVYTDNRARYEETEVACDYNAGFQSAVAGLKHFAMKARLQEKLPDVDASRTISTSEQTTKVVSTTASTKVPCKPPRSRRCLRLARRARRKKNN